MEIKSIPNQSETDFQLALKFSINYLNKQLLKNRKSDRYAFVIFNSTDSRFLYNDGPISLSYVKEFYDTASNLHQQDTGNGTETDVVKSYSEALQHQIANKFIRNIFIVTNGLLPTQQPRHYDQFQYILNSYTINTTCLVINNDNNNESKTIIENVSEAMGDDFAVYDFDDYMNAGPPMKLIGPRCVSDTYLSFAQLGGDENDESGINLKIQLYPAIRCQNQLHGHEYFVNPSSKEVSKIKRDTKYYIKKNASIEDEVFDHISLNAQDSNSKDENEDDEKIYLNRGDFSSGFKYSQQDILPVSTELDQAATLGTTPGVNILGFISRKDLPIAYLTEESNYVIPDMKLYSDNAIAFNSMVQALIDLDHVAIMRYVQKQDDEVQVCAGYPQRVKIDDEHEGFILMMNRLAMKEDEKIGKFSDLKKMQENSIDSAMEDFIKSKKLRNDQTKSNLLNNRKASLTQSVSFTPPITSETTLENILLSSSPHVKRFNHYVNKMLYKSFGQVKPLNEFIGEKDFIENTLTNDEESTLLNLDDILDTKEANFYADYDVPKANEIEDKLKNLLDVKFKIPKKTTKKKRNYESTFDFEANDGFDEYFDIDDILAG
ncbi:YKU80 [Candida jiufengensis]|uniref:YKU80 n=1 Tax=Candida jiufengensis TaxID=497108 RepID=UPI0022243A2C|nr:YKU80 [Candida jiufengensis]KAI5951106.1 YKU80 [Candida jiufengensis]